MAELRTRPELARRVSQIDAGNLHDVHVILDGDSAVVRLGETQFAERLDSYVSLQATLREQVPDIDYVDVRFGERVYVGVAQTAGAAAARRSSPVPARSAGAQAQR
jgi:cell division septal protein FtsQ